MFYRFLQFLKILNIFTDCYSLLWIFQFFTDFTHVTSFCGFLLILHIFAGFISMNLFYRLLQILATCHVFWNIVFCTSFGYFSLFVAILSFYANFTDFDRFTWHKSSDDIAPETNNTDCLWRDATSVRHDIGRVPVMTCDEYLGWQVTRCDE